MTMIDGVVITDEMLAQIREWQNQDNINNSLLTIEEVFDLLLDRDDIQSFDCDKATEYLHMFIYLRNLYKSVSAFKLKT